MTSKTKTESYAISRSYSCFHRNNNLHSGTVMTPLGIVRTSAYNGCALGHQSYSSMQFIHNGRLYDRTWPKNFSDRGLAILAGRFARDVVNGECDDQR